MLVLLIQRLAPFFPSVDFYFFYKELKTTIALHLRRSRHFPPLQPSPSPDVLLQYLSQADLRDSLPPEK